MEFLDRFTPLMSRALHYAGSPQASSPVLPLSDIHSHLCALADAERSTVYHGNAGQLDDPQRHEDLRQCRFVVYAWVDETLLNAARPDAVAWMGMSLQSRYFETSIAGREVFARLRERLDFVLRQADVPGLASQLPPAFAQQPTNVAFNPIQDEAQEGIELATDMERVATQPLAPVDQAVLRVYAQCLLYGFCGRFFPYPEVLNRLRTASRTLLQVTATAPENKGEPQIPVSPLYWLEPVLYVVVPLCATLVFALYCADILANLPLNTFGL